jgi:hypothetical protein
MHSCWKVFEGTSPPPEMYFPWTPMVKICTELQELKKLLSRLRDAGASQAGIVKLVNLRDLDYSPTGGACPVHWAATIGASMCIATLMREGADPNAVKRNGATAITSAVSCPAQRRNWHHWRDVPPEGSTPFPRALLRCRCGAVSLTPWFPPPLHPICRGVLDLCQDAAQAPAIQGG